MINELKPYIDKNYPTLPDRQHTYIGESSMGGIMSLYMIVMHSDVFSKAACISPHLYPMYKYFCEGLHHPMEENKTVYISWGGNEYRTHELFARVTDQNLQVLRALLKKTGVDVLPHVFKNGYHSEGSWKKMHVWMKELEII